ncbi:MAG: RluA family pseudouridine synthase [Planctomycetales bacterium]|nr:RluA family pseudouridine synthase [Planctomycetales bacterium]
MLIRYVVPTNIPAPGRTVSQLVQRALNIQRKAAEDLIHSGAVACRGRFITQAHIQMKPGDEIEIEFAPQPLRSGNAKASSKDRFEILYDDSELIVVNKPAGLLTVPTPHREKNTLQSQIRRWLDRQQPGASAICVHRLDRGVSGVLVFAKEVTVADKIRSQFASRKPERKYIAIVQGSIQTNNGTFRSYLATDKDLNRYSVSDSSQGELAITHFEVTERFGDATFVRVQLETGRRNQIRVHFAESSHPIIGDPRYRPSQAEHPFWPYKRLALHAESLSFMHPTSGKEIRITSSWPQEFRDFKRQSQKKAGFKRSE